MLDMLLMRMLENTYNPHQESLNQIWEIVGDLKKSVQAFTRQMLETLNPHQES
jgi:hypothetical protein